MSGLGGTFRRWQGRYAEHGIATFPVRQNKKPLVRNYQRIGLNASAQLGTKFADDSSLVICRTGSGHFAIWYRWSGETRRIRPLPDLPIDILGGGGFAIVPPSLTTGVYRFLRGGLDDLDGLPRLRGIDKIASAQAPREAASIREGRRDNWLFRRLLREARYCDDLDALLDVGRTLNMNCNIPPLSDSEVTAITRSAWGYEISGKNWVGRHARASTDREEILSLSSDPSAALLLMLLRVSHPTLGDRFAIDQVKTGDLLGWHRETVRSRIRYLMKKGHLERVYHGGRGKGDPHLYQLRKPDRDDETTTI